MRRVFLNGHEFPGHGNLRAIGDKIIGYTAFLACYDEHIFSFRRWAAGTMVAFVSCVFVLFFVQACDTEATFYLTQRHVEQIVPLAMVQQSCLPDAASGKDKAQRVIHFSLLTNDAEMLLPGMRTDDSADKAWLYEYALTPESFDISHAVAFEVDAQTGGDKGCESDVDCDTNFKCQYPADLDLGAYYYPPIKQCMMDLDMRVVGEASFTARQYMPSVPAHANFANAAFKQRALTFAVDNDELLATLDAQQFRRRALVDAVSMLNAEKFQSVSRDLYLQLGYISSINDKGVLFANAQFFSNPSLTLRALRDDFPQPIGQYDRYNGLSSCLDELYRVENGQRGKTLISISRTVEKAGDAADSHFLDTMAKYDVTPTYFIELNPGNNMPSREAAQIADQTCGGYFYLQQWEGLSALLMRLMYAMPGMWQLPVAFKKFNGYSGWVRVSATVQMKTAKGHVRFEAQRLQNVSRETIDRRWLTYVNP